MKRILSAVIKGRKTTIFLLFVFMILGIYNYIIMPRQETPDINVPYAKITVTWMGASPEEIEKQITAKIEDMVAEIPGTDTIQSYSRNSVSIVVVKLDTETDVEKFWTKLREKAVALEGSLPDNASSLDINTDLTETAGMIIAMSGEHYSYDELAEFAENIGRELGKVDGVSRFDVIGSQDRYIKVKVDIGKLNQFNLSLSRVSDIIAARNQIIPLGSLKNNDTVINVAPTGDFDTLSDIGNLILLVSPENGSMTRLKDIATITEDYQDSNSRMKQNGENAVLLTGFFKSDQNIVEIGKNVDEVIQRFKSDLPENVLFDEVLFQPKTVGDSVNTFIINFLEAILLIIMTVFLGMGFKNAIITSLSLPLSVAITFSAMAVLNIQIHQISISALIIALGMLVDNAVVVNDSIQVHIDNGEERTSACVNGVKEVYVPILTSTLTTVGAFVPLLLLTGTAGDYIRSIPQVVIISLSASYFVAVFALPVFAWIFLKPSKIQKNTARIRHFFVNALSKALKKKVLILSATFFFFLGALGLATTLGLRFFPPADTDMVYMNINVPSSIHLDETEAVVKNIEAIIKEQPEVTQYTAAIGDGLPKFFATLPPMNASKDYAQIMMRLDLSLSERFQSNAYFVSYMQALIDSTVAKAVVTVKELEQGDPTGAPITVKLSGNDMEELFSAASLIKDELQKIPGTTNVDDNRVSNILEFEMSIDPVKSSMTGLSVYEVQKEAGIALNGYEASVYKEHGNEFPIVIESNIETKEQLENLGVQSSMTGKKILLKDVTDIKLIDSTPIIMRNDRELSITVTSDSLPGFSAVEIQNEITQKIETLNFDGVTITYEGEKQKIVDYFGDLGILSIFALLIIFSILLVQFNSFRQPIIIFATIPLSLIGSIIGLKIFGQPLSFTALLGMVSLLGMVVNNAIILIDFINIELREGIPLEEACMIAVDKRFRPIILTTTTTVIGLIPLVLTGGELFQPLAISLMFGLMVSMVLTLIIVPVTFSVVERKSRQAT